MENRWFFQPWLFGAVGLILFCVFGVQGKIGFFHWWKLCFVGIGLLCWIALLIVQLKRQRSCGRRKIWCAVIVGCILVQVAVVGVQMHSGSLEALLREENIVVGTETPRILIVMREEAPYELEGAAAQTLWDQLAEVKGRNLGRVTIPADESLSWLSVYTADGAGAVLRITPDYGSGLYFVKIGEKQYRLTLNTRVPMLLAK